MAIPERGFEGIVQCESLKLCGNCGRVTFSLSREDQKLLNKLILWHGVELMRCWLKKGTVMVPGGHHVDQQKTKAVQLINDSRTRCPRADTDVTFVDYACFAWIPRSS